MCFSWFFFVLAIVFFLLGMYLFNSFSLVVEVFCPVFYVFDLSICFCFDYVSVFFFSCVSIISSVVFFYSVYYMNIDEKTGGSMMENRFLVLLFFFVFSMFLLVFSYSWFLIMLGWDGLGVVSFLLVIYYNDSKSLDSGMLTVLMNRMGDCFFLLSFSFMFYLGEFSYQYYLNGVDLIFVLIVILGCTTKSAQMPFSSWLPAAMAAPTPVSSLVHSSTLVTAGIYLLIRFNYLLEGGYFYLMAISLFTMMMAGIFANYELDFKKVVAMSTLSQLGFMIFCISSGNWILAFLHMIFHAFFKSSLFLSTGSLMHLIYGGQDSRYFSGFFTSFFSKLFFFTSCISLMGFPFTLGFYSKDMILGELGFFQDSFLIIIFVFSCFYTVSYSLRLMKLGFLGYLKSDSFMEFGEDKKFFIPVCFLFFLVVFSGSYFMFYFFFFSEIFGFMELFMGIIVILGGYMVFQTIPLFYKVYYFFVSMMNIGFFVSLISLKTLKNSFYLDESSWGELLGGKGLSSFTGYLQFIIEKFLSMKVFLFGFLIILYIFVLS